MIGMCFIQIKKMSDRNKVNVGLIGYGYWGKNILRNLIENSLSGQIFVCDVHAERLQQAKAIYSSVYTTEDFDSVINNQEVDAIVIATPTSTHYTLAKEALLKKKHVFLEKPLTTNTAEAVELIDIAKKNELVLMVDHVYLYNQVVRQLKKYISREFLGNINYIDATRINLGIYHTDTNVLWDLACHDISIISYLVEEMPLGVRAIGRINPVHKVEDITYLFLYYASGMLVQINSSWASPVKIRKMIIGGEKRMIIYDDIEATNKLIIYDYESTQMPDNDKSRLVDYRLGNITIPKFDLSEALRNAIDVYYNSILTAKPVLDEAFTGLGVVRVLEKAQESLKSGGAIMPIY